MERSEDEKKGALKNLKILQSNTVIFQRDVRMAVTIAIELLEKEVKIKNG